MMPRFDRRGFTTGLAALGALAAGPRAARAAGPRLTARTVVERIQRQCAREGIAWSEKTVDTFKFGDPNTKLTGIACTFMGTLDLLRRAARAGANFVISHEPVFYDHYDDTARLADDPIYRAKTDFARDHGLVIWRFHDHVHRLKPEPMSSAMIARLGWERYVEPGTAGFDRRIVRPRLPLAALVQEIGARMPSASVRFVGDPALPVGTIGLMGHFIPEMIETFQACDVAIAFEVREWDCVEYVRDALALGEKKALILLAHERGEQDGMKLAADWLRPLVPEVPVLFIPSGEPFRNLAAA